MQNQEFRDFLRQRNQTQLIQYCQYVNEKIQLEDNINKMINQKLNKQKYEAINKKITELYCNEHQIEINYNIQPEFYDNEYGDTIALWLVKNGFKIPQCWYHDPEIQDIYGNTVAIIQARKGMMLSRQWMPDNYKRYQISKIQLELQNRNLPVPQHWKDDDMTIFDQAIFGIIPKIRNHEPDEQNEDGWTVAMILALNNIKIPKKWNHEPQLQNKYNMSVAFYMMQNEVEVPKKWQYNIDINSQNMNIFINMLIKYKLCVPKWCFSNPNKLNKKGRTVAMILLQNKLQIPEYLYHDPNIKDQYNRTIFDFYVEQGIVPPKWCYKQPNYQDQDGNTQAMILIKYNMNIPECLFHNPNIQNKKGQTVAIILALNGKIPDKHWLHDKYLRYKKQLYHSIRFYTVQNILQKQRIQVPEEWKYTPLNEDEDSQAMIDARNSIIPEIDNNDPQYKNIRGETVASILICKYIIPPKQWLYDPTQRNYLNLSFDNLLKRRQLPVLQHYKDNERLTIFDQAWLRQIPDINDHKPEEQDQDGFTVAMILAINKMQIPEQWYHDANIRNSYGQTTAMVFARQGIMPPKQWEHDPNLQDYKGMTVAMNLASRSIDPPKQWYHDITLKDINGFTVARFLAKYGIVPSQYWFPCRNVQNEKYKLIKELLQNYIYVQKDGQFIFNYKTQNVNSICQLCFTEGQQDFIITSCKHEICINCFQQLMKQHTADKCPICRENDWYQQIDL